MTKFLGEALQSFSKNPIIGFMMICLGAVWYLYNDLSNFIHSQQQILTKQVQTQQETTDLLNQISMRIAEIEMKIFEDKIQSGQNK